MKYFFKKYAIYGSNFTEGDLGASNLWCITMVQVCC